METNQRSDNINKINNFTPIYINSIFQKDSRKNNRNDEEKLLKICLNEMKKKLQFVDKTNWMFRNNFDTHFLEK